MSRRQTSLAATALVLFSAPAPAAPIGDVSGRWILQAPSTGRILSTQIQLTQTRVASGVSRLEGSWGGRPVIGYISAGRFTLTTQPSPHVDPPGPGRTTRFPVAFSGRYFVIVGMAETNRLPPRARMRGEMYDAQLDQPRELWQRVGFTARR